MKLRTVKYSRPDASAATSTKSVYVSNLHKTCVSCFDKDFKMQH